MQSRVLAAVCATLSCFPNASGAQRVSQPVRDEFMAAVFASRQQGWIMLCDSAELSVGVRNDAESLFVDAIVWNDGTEKVGVEPSTHQRIGDYSVLQIHFGTGSSRAAGRDVNVILNPWPEVPGLRLSRYLAENVTTTMQVIAGAQGEIRYVPGGSARLIRIDRYKVPLSALGLKPGAAVSVAFYVFSPVPALVTSSVAGFERGSFYPSAIPIPKYAAIELRSPP